MKYIRTKDGIYEVIHDEKNLIYKGSNMIAIYEPKIYQVKDIHKDEILKSADNIKELCDEFVCGEHLLKPKFTKFDDEGYATETYHQGIINAFKSGVNYKDYCWYGAIWTDKGLIYVAKMNDKGELELI